MGSIPLQSLLSRWADERIRLLPPELPKSIIEAFDRAGSSATPDVIALYSHFGGMEVMDDGFLRVWPLREVEEHSNDRSSFGLVFADHFVNSWCYRLRPASADESAVYMDYFNGGEPKLIATNVLQFLELYEREPKWTH